MARHIVPCFTKLSPKAVRSEDKTPLSSGAVLLPVIKWRLVLIKQPLLQHEANLFSSSSSRFLLIFFWLRHDRTSQIFRVEVGGSHRGGGCLRCRWTLNRSVSITPCETSRGSRVTRTHSVGPQICFISHKIASREIRLVTSQRL